MSRSAEGHEGGLWSFPRTNLQVGDVPIDAHRGSHTVLRHILVVAGARLVVNGVHTGNGDALIAPGNVPATGRDMSAMVPDRDSLGPTPSHRETHTAVACCLPAHSLFCGNRSVWSSVAKCLAHLQRVPHRRVEAGAL